MKIMSKVISLIDKIRNAHHKVAKAENALGSVHGGYGWNAACSKVEIASKEFSQALNALKEYVQELEGDRAQNECSMRIVSSHLDQIDYKCDLCGLDETMTHLDSPQCQKT